MMSVHLDIGSRFGRLTVVEFKPTTPLRGKYLLSCDCGQVTIASGSQVRAGVVSSCGCLRRERTIRGSETHGMSSHELYPSYCGMKARCFNPRHHAYGYYGGRGITVCERWLSGEGDRTGFECFLADMGERPSPGMTIDRFPNGDGNYEPSNCRWASRLEQSRNRRKSTSAGRRDK